MIAAPGWLTGFCRYSLSQKVKWPQRSKATSLAQLATGHWVLPLSHPPAPGDVPHVPFLVSSGSSELNTDSLQLGLKDDELVLG